MAERDNPLTANLANFNLQHRRKKRPLYSIFYLPRVCWIRSWINCSYRWPLCNEKNYQLVLLSRSGERAQILRDDFVFTLRRIFVFIRIETTLSWNYIKLIPNMYIYIYFISCRFEAKLFSFFLFLDLISIRSLIIFIQRSDVN